MLYIIGSGPGTGEYLTVKGMKILRKADVVYYHTFGMFGSEDILKFCKVRCEKIKATSDVTERVLFYKKNSNKLCVELVNNDITFYSTVQNLIDALDELQVKYEIVPGVSALNGASALLKSQLVLPCIAHSCIVTYLDEFDIIPEQSIRALAVHGSTLVVFMPRDYLIGRLKEQLLVGGVSLDTPVAVVYKIGFKEEQVLRMTVSDIDSLNGDVINSIIVIGWVLADKNKRFSLSGLPFSTNFMKAEQFIKEKGIVDG